MRLPLSFPLTRFAVRLMSAIRSSSCCLTSAKGDQWFSIACHSIDKCRHVLSSVCGALRMAECIFFTSSTFVCIFSIFSRICSTYKLSNSKCGLKSVDGSEWSRITYFLEEFLHISSLLLHADGDIVVVDLGLSRAKNESPSSNRRNLHLPLSKRPICLWSSWLDAGGQRINCKAGFVWLSNFCWFTGNGQFGQRAFRCFDRRSIGISCNCIN